MSTRGPGLGDAVGMDSGIRLRVAITDLTSPIARIVMGAVSPREVTGG